MPDDDDTMGTGKEAGPEGDFLARQGEGMEYLGLIVSWMKDVIRNFPASASEPDVWGAILAIFLLLVLLSVASSQRRIKREIAAISSELSSIRSTLRKIDMAVGRMELGQLEGGEEEKDIWKLAFRLDDDKPKRE